MTQYINLFNELDKQKENGTLKYKRLYNAINLDCIGFVQDDNVFWCELSQYSQVPYYNTVLKQAKQYLKETRNLTYYLDRGIKNDSK